MAVSDALALPTAAQFASSGGRLLVAALLGGLIGAQREKVHSAAGFRTHILVSLGAALFMLAGHDAGFTSSDMSRVVQGVVAGIGFLGAGTILKMADKGQVYGLTTAASIWVTSGVGIACGCAPIWLPILAAVLTWAVLVLALRLEGRRTENGSQAADGPRPSS